MPYSYDVDHTGQVNPPPVEREPLLNKDDNGNGSAIVGIVYILFAAAVSCVVINLFFWMVR